MSRLLHVAGFVLLCEAAGVAFAGSSDYRRGGGATEGSPDRMV